MISRKGSQNDHLNKSIIEVGGLQEKTISDSTPVSQKQCVRLQWARAHQKWTVDYWKNIACSRAEVFDLPKTGQQCLHHLGIRNCEEQSTNFGSMHFIYTFYTHTHTHTSIQNVYVFVEILLIVAGLMVLYMFCSMDRYCCFMSIMGCPGATSETLAVN